jgi:hypothetical protein
MVKQNIKFDIVGGYSKEEYNELDPQETVNMFRVNAGSGKKALFPSPGLSLDNGIEFVQTPSNRGGRNAYVFNDRIFAVIGEDIYRCNESAGTLDHIKIDSINTQRGYVGIANLEKELVFADGANAWIWNSETSAFSQISFGFDILPIDVTAFKNRIIALNGETGQWYYSEVNDATSWDVFNINTFPNGDINVASAALGDRLYIMGKESVEIYAVRQGATLFPFAPAEPLLEIGCASAASVASNFGILVWLSRTNAGVGSVVATTGGQPQTISDQAVDTALDAIGDVSDVSGYIYKNENGHIMYRMSTTAGNKTFEYDFRTKEWNTPQHAKKKDPAGRHLSQKHVYFNSKHYVIDYSEPKLYEMSNLYYDDAGTKIRRKRVSNILEAPPKSRITVNSVTFRLKQGTGGDCGIEENPLLYLRLSNDEGESYGNQLTAEIGKVGRRTWETTFDVGLDGRSIVFELEHYAARPLVILQADLNIDIVEME